MKMLKSVMVLMTVISSQSLFASYNPNATSQRLEQSSVTETQKADNTGDKTCPFAHGAKVALLENSNPVVTRYGTTNLKTRSFKGTDSHDDHP
jgi:hypothetical protein